MPFDSMAIRRLMPTVEIRWDEKAGLRTGCGVYAPKLRQKSKTKVKTVPGREKTKAQRRVSVTALMAWPAFHVK
jgi:hypothetical protein